MKHGRAGKKLERNRNGRRALVRSLVESLVIHGRIRTTEARAKELKSRIDRVLNAAKESHFAVDPARRIAVKRSLRSRYSSSTCDRLDDSEFIQNLSERKSGYSRVVKLSPRRGDGARMSIIEIVDVQPL